jgi:hypothetical protein
MTKEAKQVNDITRLSIVAVHEISTRNVHFHALEILANLSSGSELPVCNGLFPIEDTGGRLRHPSPEMEYGIVLASGSDGDFRWFLRRIC